MKFLGDSLVIFNALTEVCCCVWELICTRITYPPLCLHIHIYTSIFYIQMYIKKHFVYFIISFLLSCSKGYAQTVSHISPWWMKYIQLQFNLLLMKITCHRIIITSLLVNKMLPWADHFVLSQGSSSQSGFGYVESFPGLRQIHLPAFH